MGVGVDTVGDLLGLADGLAVRLSVGVDVVGKSLGLADGPAEVVTMRPSVGWMWRTVYSGLRIDLQREWQRDFQ
jgi:hypothetical protein